MMISFAYVAMWLSMAIWAAWFVSRRVADRGTRIAYYLLIWLVPIVGAAAAVLIIGFGGDRNSMSSADRMFDAVVDEHKKTQDS
jgi:hypothetical protein